MLLGNPLMLHTRHSLSVPVYLPTSKAAHSILVASVWLLTRKQILLVYIRINHIRVRSPQILFNAIVMQIGVFAPCLKLACAL
jgi:hypothetical protein